ncbi:ArsR family transcriptional regulator [uncultured Microbacterium sp.]|uniref:arsenate reductase/protein-tyrosine-phosphatase family protein n=1 Tax=uncultured Microbacterium sp. TaxID=191216 RepID=UPI0025FCA72D|nr:ArsR family transcriptional regulator [uncultured Microbacterium sp.]
MDDLQRRVHAFAALGDRGRLRIVDLLAVGDKSSSEIAAALGMKSNLVAFHTNVLHERGIVRRVRSESDGRRTYLQLIPEAFTALGAVPTPVAGRVVFVCTANSARSQLAQAIWAEHSDIPAASAGMQPADRVHPGAIDAAARHRIPLNPDAVPRSLDRVARPGDFLISVCDQAHEQLRGRDDVHWSIRDPARNDRVEAFDATVSELRSRIATVAAQLVAG